MIFNSFEFLIFFIVFFIFWPFAKTNSFVRWIYIIVFSLFFYGWWDWKFIPLLVLTALIDFYSGRWIFKYHNHRKFILVFSILSNLLVLGYFKYSFFLGNLFNDIFSIFSVNFAFTPKNLALPLGISFYTFQSMSYTIDIYRKELKPASNFIHFLSAITLFPHLVAGPIMRASKLLPQLKENKKVSNLLAWQGLRLIVNGYFKKVVIADNLANAVSDAFSGHLTHNGFLDWWLIVTMFSMQIYCDFSGYSDIARGLANWLGYDFTLNFNHPYFSKSMKEFWRRWHISLSSWFRDYLFIPLGGSKGSNLQTNRNLFITFSLSGLWHGAGLTFLVWGMLHSLYQIIEKTFKYSLKLNKTIVGGIIAWLLVIFQVWIAWVFFRANDIVQALEIIGYLFSFEGFHVSVSTTSLVFLFVGILHEIIIGRATILYGLSSKNSTLFEALAIIIMIVMCVFFRGPGNAFIYFQF